MKKLTYEDKIQLFLEICDMIQTKCHIPHYTLFDFIVNEEEFSQQFRLSGKFGFGFKLIKSGKLYMFTQYREDQTEESIKWIDDNNKYLKRIQEEQL